MIPSEYRLENVAAGLIERLDGARRSYDDEAAAEVAFERLGREYVEAVVAEWTELAFQEDPSIHSAFLRREIVETVVPRFHRVAWKMNQAEAAGYGLGWWATAPGRVALFAVALLIFWLVLIRFLAFVAYEWPLLLLDFSLPFLPDVMAWLEHRRYRLALEELVTDMARIQKQTQVYSGSSLGLGAGGEVAPVVAPRRSDSVQSRAKTGRQDLL